MMQDSTHNSSPQNGMDRKQNLAHNVISERPQRANLRVNQRVNQKRGARNKDVCTWSDTVIPAVETLEILVEDVTNGWSTWYPEDREEDEALLQAHASGIVLPLVRLIQSVHRGGNSAKTKEEKFKDVRSRSSSTEDIQKKFVNGKSRRKSTVLKKTQWCRIWDTLQIDIFYFARYPPSYLFYCSLSCSSLCSKNKPKTSFIFLTF